ncbi:unnamed protein product [Parascedosporium putredinis]|uniref:MYND-type zinc finger protein samB n=1 Tax=Parascedosporium putredinis TaxID=1442378 RepID=A0A9P1GTD9_9PEZI|nr:unnamed protein product [Parascedosporium putredinis]CAI7987274.1 unnamed protein product [Parascedosporium putredinis]
MREVNFSIPNVNKASGRSRDMMGMWKWNLAFQCVVNIGVRGSEAVRTRVVEADMVPVIATILDNYIKVVEKCREKAEEAKQNTLMIIATEVTSIEKPPLLPTVPISLNLTSEPFDARPPPSLNVTATYHSQASSSSPSNTLAEDTVPDRRARTTSADRGASSLHTRHNAPRSDDMGGDSMQSDEAPDADMSGAGDIQAPVGIQDITMGEEGESMLAATTLDLGNPTASETQEAGAFNITHRGPIVDGSITNPTTAPVPAIGLSPNRPVITTPPQPVMPNTGIPRYLLDRHFVPNTQMLAAMPREEDVMMSLQLLAYVSKYCALRSYFLKSHLVPRLRIGKEINLLDGEDIPSGPLEDEQFEEEYLLPDDFNLFPLVEKFTVRYHSQDMQYWAGVVMRNLCRKDDTRGGIRQCAYYQCGKWEEYTRQFAKCRRCRRTKYCSKECQKSAWAFHRHWCIAAGSNQQQ